MSRLYTRDHLWLERDEESLVTHVGITAKGDELMGGITFVEVMPDMICVEGSKSSVEIKPNFGQPMFVVPFDSWSEDKPVAGLSCRFHPMTCPCMEELMDEEQYKEYIDKL